MRPQLRPFNGGSMFCKHSWFKLAPLWMTIFLDFPLVESDSEEEDYEDSPRGSSMDDLSDDASDTSKHWHFCSGNWNQGWAGFCFFGANCCFFCCDGTALSTFVESSSWLRNWWAMSRSTCWSQEWGFASEVDCCGVLTATEAGASCPWSLVLPTLAHNCSNCFCNLRSKVLDLSSLFSTFDLLFLWG